MILLLDTTVVSELMKPDCDEAVCRFVARQPAPSLFLPALVAAELRYGLLKMLLGARRLRLEGALETLLNSGFRKRMFVFDDLCARGYAIARTRREAAGRRTGMIDALIGGMALAHGATLVTLNTLDFDGYGLVLVNPWLVA